jgi:hypothetical protein
MTPEVATTVSAIAASLSAVLTIVTAVVAIQTLRAARIDSRGRSRPVIIASLQRELLTQGTLNLVIRNFGVSVASNVRVSFDPMPPSDLDSLPSGDMRKWLFETYEKPIQTWPPGWELSNVVRAGHDDIEPFAILIEYCGPDNTRYSERIDIDPTPVLKHTTATPTKADDPVKIGQQAVSALQALVRAIHR